MTPKKQYLGDGVYVEFVAWVDGGFEIVLTTENGIDVTNRIVLEPDVWFFLVRGRRS